MLRSAVFLLFMLWLGLSFQVQGQPPTPQAFSFIELAHAQALLRQGDAVPEDSQLIALLTVARDYLEVHLRLDSTLLLAEEVMIRAEQKEELRGIAANACFKKAQTLRFSDWVIGKEAGGLGRVWTMDEYVPWYRQAARMGLEAKDYTLVRAVYAELSEIFQEVSQDDSAQLYLQKSLVLAKTYCDPADVASAYVTLGEYYVNHLYIEQGRAYVDSIKAKLDSIPEPRRLWVESYLYEMESGLAALVENFPEALRANYLALEALKKLDNPARVMTAELLQGAFWRKIGILDSAVAYLYAARDRMEAEKIESVNHRYAIHHMLEGTMVEMNNAEVAARHRIIVDSLRPLAAPILAGKYALAEMNLALEAGNLARYRSIYEQTDWASLRNGPNQLKPKIDLLEARVAYLVDHHPAKALALYRVIRETTPSTGDGKVANLTLIETYYHSARCHLLLGQPQAAMADIAEAERLMAGYAVLLVKAKVFLVAIQAAQQLRDPASALQYERRYAEALDEQAFAQYNMAT